MNGARANASQQTQQAAMDTLDFSRLTPVSGSTRVNGKAVAYRSYENVVYVRNPVDAEYQSLNIYVPEAYFQGGTIHGYTARTAPIFLPNQVGGYMPAKPGVVGQAGLVRATLTRPTPCRRRWHGVWWSSRPVREGVPRPPARRRPPSST